MSQIARYGTDQGTAVDECDEVAVINLEGMVYVEGGRSRAQRAPYWNEIGGWEVRNGDGRVEAHITAEGSTRPCRGKKMRRLEQKKTAMERIADSISTIHAAISVLKENITRFIERQDRECNHDEEFRVIQ